MTNTFLQYQLSQLCQNAIETCPFTDPAAGADCTKKFCTGFPAYIGVGTCVSLGYDPDNCCTSSDPTACLENFAHGSSGGGSSGTGAANVCASVISILETCFTLNPSLSPSAIIATSGPSATALASCACYDTNGTYDPDEFDNYASECQASGSAAHPTYFPIVTPLIGFCTNNAGPESVAASTTVAGAATTSNQVTSSAGNEGASATSASGGLPTSDVQSTAAAALTTSVGMGTSPSATSASPAQTTTSKSDGVKVTLRKSAILLFGFGALASLYL